MSRYRIRNVSQLSGVSTATLRAWERRYGVPSPARTASAYRLYSDADVALIKRMRDLVSSGVAAAEAARAVVLQGGAAASAPITGEEVDPFGLACERIVEATSRFDPEALELAVSRTLTLGPAVTIFDRAIGPALRRIGDLWHEGTVTIAQEHLASQVLIGQEAPGPIRGAVIGMVGFFGAVGILVNNAGYGQYGPLEEISLGALRAQFETNVFGGLRLAQLVLPAMRRKGHGRIVNVSSVAGRVSSIGGGAYHAIVGTLLQGLVCAAISIPVGVFVGIYLVEYGGSTRLGRVTTFMVDILTGVPSIVAALFIYALWVATFGFPRSGFAVSLALVAIPGAKRVDVVKGPGPVGSGTPPPVVPQKRSVLPAVVLWGVGGAAVVAGAVLEGVAASELGAVNKLSDGIDAAKTNCVAGSIRYDANCNELESKAKKVDTLGRTGVGLLVVGGVAAAGGLVYFLWPEKRAQGTARPLVVPVVSAGGGGLVVSGTF